MGLKYYKDKNTLVDITASTKFSDIIGSDSEASISITATPKWKYKVQTSQELVWAVQNRITSIVLQSDINVTADLDFEAAATTAASNRTCTTLDLNGYVLTGDFEIKLLNADLVLIDSRPTATHSDLSLPRGGIIGEEVFIYATSSGSKPMDWPSNTVYANGGTITGATSISGALASIVSNGGSHTNFRETVNNSSGTINSGSYVLPQVFVNVVSEKAIAPTAPSKSGYKLAGWSRNGEYFNFNYTVKSNMTLTAIWALPGDTNGDGDIDILDLVRLKKYTVKATECKAENRAAADMDDSGSINSLDLTILKKLLLGILN